MSNVNPKMEYKVRSLFGVEVILIICGLMPFIIVGIRPPEPPSGTLWYLIIVMMLICAITALYLHLSFYLIISRDGIVSRCGRQIDSMKWSNIESVGYFMIRGQPIMFFSTIPGIWKIHGMFGNDLPLSVLIKVFPNKKIEALVKEYYKGEIVYLE